MPRPQNATETRLQNTIISLSLGLKLLNTLHELNIPFAQLMSSTVLSLVNVVQNVKRNREECIQLLEHIQRFIYAISEIYLQSETGDFSPIVLVSIGEFTRTLQKTHTFIEAQQDGNKLRSFFRQTEMSSLLKDCQTGLEQALANLNIHVRHQTWTDVNEFNAMLENTHTQLLQFASTTSEYGSSADKSSSIYRGGSDSFLSSRSFSLLPATPKIFYGRDSEVDRIMTILTDPSPRIPILGGAGMGKT
ncbi:hypothetical protein R3P38DRAFT_2784003 [Favolaschia claudopus]|uniref:Fungal N-terminal domain-containing protein n=1 Tax=Favolaschia claudopus TaxID=2862362 RepID=A0AAW0AYA8_9AGAR